MAIGTPISGDAKVQCTRCNRQSVVNKLTVRNGSSFPKGDGEVGVWMSRFFYCVCDDLHPLVYDPGDEVLMLVPCAHVVRV